MRKQIALTLIALIAAIAPAMADVSLTFNDNGGGGGTATSGSYAPGATITFDITMVYTGAPPSDLGGYSLYFQSLQGAALQGNRFTITGFDHSGSLFNDIQNGTFPDAMNFGTTGADNQFDLGATLPTPTAGQPAGSYFLGTITFQISGPVSAGQTYTLRNVFAPIGNPDAGHGSIATNKAGTQSFDIPSSSYTITIIPEPATWSLMALGGLAFAGATRMRRQRS